MILLHRSSRTLVHVRCFADILQSLLRNPHLSSLSSQSFKSISTCSNQHSFIVSYLINSCGLTPEQALNASKFLKFQTTDRPDSVLIFFKNHGFSKTQISTVTRKIPQLLLSDPNKTLLPKFEFFYSIGISKADLPQNIVNCPIVLRRSLEKLIIPSYNFFKSLMHSDTKFLAAFNRYPGILGYDHKIATIPNIEVLRQTGVPESNILFLLTKQPKSLLTKPERYKAIVDEVKERGFNPLTTKFVIAVYVMISMGKSSWKRKMEVYEKWGWSKEETILAFQKQPWCMTISEERIAAIMDFLVNTMGWDPSVIARRPNFMSLSLEKRIVPRCSVVHVLLSKGLIKKRLSANKLLESTESLFLQKFVIPYNEKVPELLKLYQDKVGLQK